MVKKEGSLIKSLWEAREDIFLQFAFLVVGLFLWVLAKVCHPWKEVCWPDPGEFEVD